MAKQPATPPFISLTLDPDAPRPLYRQLYDGMRTAILAGQLPPGTQLPATRALAEGLHVSRFTVVSAFEQLLAEGYVEGRVGSGTYVSQVLPERSRLQPDHAMVRPAGLRRLSRRGQMLAAARVITAPDEGKPAAFRPGQPALDHFPAATWARIAARLYRRPPHALLSYGTVAGYGPLRQAIAAYLHVARALTCRPEQVIVVAGAQQALDLVARVLLDPGDAAWMEEPGYAGARGALQGAGAEIVPVPVDEEGLDVAAGERMAPLARVAYVTPAHHYPLGVTMSLGRRLALLGWARRTGAWVLEDDYDSEFRYTGHPLAALAGLDSSGQVLYLGTFSKVLFPALRLGYLVVPEDVAEAVTRARAQAGRHAPTLEQAVLAEFIAEGHFAQHIRKMRALYMERQSVLLEAAGAELAGLLDVQPSAAGMHLVGWLAPGQDDQEVALQAARWGVEVRPLSAYTSGPVQRPGLLLGYTALDEQEIRSGVRRLALALSS